MTPPHNDWVGDVIGFRRKFRFEGMQAITPSQFGLACDSQESRPRVEAMYARLRRTMPHLSATLRPDATFAECGGDSLDLVELCCAIDSDYGIRLSIEDLASVHSMLDLLLLIDLRAVRRPTETSS